MKYTKKEQLTIIRIDEYMENISMEELKQVLFDHPSNMIYCELRGKLFGVISTGDIYRSYGKMLDSVKINRDFSYIYVGEYMKARTIFREKGSINALPMVSKEGSLIGDYTRWDDLIMLENILTTREKANNRDDKRKIALVRPNNNFREKWKIYNRFKEYLQEQNLAVQCIDYSEVIQCLKSVDLVAVIDENEKRAWNILLMIAGGENKGKFNKICTYKDIFGDDVDHLSDEKYELYLKSLHSQGIGIMGLTFDECSYSKHLEKEIHERFAFIGENPINKLRKPMYKDFFDDLYSEEYANEILNIPFACENNGGALRLRDCKSKYYNVANGERRTVGQPEKYEKSIYFFGACYVYGHWVEDKNTIESFLQKSLCNNKKAVRVINCGCLGMEINTRCLIRIMTTRLKRGDLIVIGELPKGIEDVEYLDLNKVLERNKVGAGWLIDSSKHCNHKVKELYADAIYEKIKDDFGQRVEGQGTVIEKDTNFIKILYLDNYFADFDTSEYKKVGSIVMNCNPFTYGHRYLIERALKMVDFLIIFVVEEDLSLFSFTERFTMVREGVADLENVMVVPSGPFILSQMSFPEYFIKETSEDIVEHTEQDIITFAKKIAPQLGIKYRFCGEEPEDGVTNQYNMAMKKILPQYDMELIEIPRKTVNGKYISASSVRRYMEENNWEKLMELLPKTTRRILGLEMNIG